MYEMTLIVEKLREMAALLNAMVVVVVLPQMFGEKRALLTEVGRN